MSISSQVNVQILNSTLEQFKPLVVGINTENQGFISSEKKSHKQNLWIGKYRQFQDTFSRDY